MTAELQRASCDIYRAAVEEAYMAGYLEAVEREREKRKARKEKRERKKIFSDPKAVWNCHPCHDGGYSQITGRGRNSGTSDGSVGYHASYIKGNADCKQVLLET